MYLLALTHPGRQLCDRIFLEKYSWGNIAAKIFLESNFVTEYLFCKLVHASFQQKKK